MNWSVSVNIIQTETKVLYLPLLCINRSEMPKHFGSNSGHFSTGAELSGHVRPRIGHLNTGAELSGHFGPRIGHFSNGADLSGLGVCQ